MLALSTKTIVGHPPQAQHQPWRWLTAADTERAGAVGGHVGLLPALKGDGDVAGDAAAAAACVGTAGVAVVGAAGCSKSSDPDAVDSRGGGGGGTTGSRPPPIKAGAGAEDLVGLTPQQLIEQVLAAREVAARAAKRADAAERAASSGFHGHGQRGPGDTGAAGRFGSDGGRFFGGNGIGGGSDGSDGVDGGQAGEEAGAPLDVAVEELSSRRLLASAVKDFSSAVGEFSEVSRIWLEQVNWNFLFEVLCSLSRERVPQHFTVEVCSSLCCYSFN